MKINKNIYASSVLLASMLFIAAPLVASAQYVTTTTSTAVPVAVAVPATLPAGWTLAEYQSVESEIASLLSEIQTLQTEVNESGLGGSSSCYIFNNNLALGSTGPDVTALQTFLINKGYLEITMPTAYFGTLTQAALEKYQLANNIAPSSYGYVDVTTRALLNACGVVPVTLPVVVTVPVVTTPVTTTTSNTTGMPPVITSLSTSQAASGSTVSVFGNGFAPSGNTLTFTSILNATSSITVANLPSSGGGSISFVVPAVNHSVDPTSSTTCASESSCMNTGPYNVTLTNGSGTSNAVSFGIE